MRHVVDRFVAGETLDDALAVTRRLNGRGASVTLDYLGESVHDAAVAEQVTEVYVEALARIGAERLLCGVSVKPTAAGLDVSPELCRRLVARICDAAAQVGEHVTLDMEDSARTQATVDLVLSLRSDGHDNVGCAVQAYLRRTAEDVAKLTASGASLRLCKGAYAEPPELAFQTRRAVSANYARLADVLVRSGTFGRFATHDHRLVARVQTLAARYQVPRDAYEFQMLYGVREPLQHAVLRDGFALRVYVPFGDQWYAYFVRRLAERPANLTFFLRALTSRRS